MGTSSILLVGATGLLGGEVVRQLAQTDHQVRALVRVTADPAKRAALAELANVELVAGDLKIPGSLADACRGVSTVVTTASATAATLPGDSVETVDDVGQQALLAAAVTAGVRRFVYVSFPHMDADSPLQQAKRRMERAIRSSNLEYVILQPTYFTEVWFSPALGWDPGNGRARLLGDANAKTSWISFRDVARFVTHACRANGRASLTLKLGGPEALSQEDVLAMYSELGIPRPPQVEVLSAATLEKVLENASSPLEATFAAMMLTVARGQPIDPAEQLAILPGVLATVKEHVRRSIGKL